MDSGYDDDLDMENRESADPKRMFTVRIDLKLLSPFITNQPFTSNRLHLGSCFVGFSPFFSSLWLIG